MIYWMFIICSIIKVSQLNFLEFKNLILSSEQVKLAKL